jgi:putative spermidine/putrescine transport system permease protein
MASSQALSFAGGIRRRLGPRMRIVALVALVLPFWVSILVRTYSWIVLLGREGVVNDILMRLGIIDEPLSLLYRELGVMIGTINILAPFFVMPMVAAMSAVDPRLTQAALSLGASRFQAFWRVFFPLTVPTLVTGAFLVFILTFGFYVTPAVIGGGRVKMLATLLDHLINTSSDWSLAAALSFFLLAATLGVVMLARALTALTRAGRRRAR